MKKSVFLNGEEQYVLKDIQKNFSVVMRTKCNLSSNQIICRLHGC